MLVESIHVLLAELMSAIWERARDDPTFSVVDFYLHITEYTPQTNKELAAWAELTAPSHFEDLVTFLQYRRSMENMDPNIRGFDDLILEAARERRWQTERNPTQQTEGCDPSREEPGTI